MTDYNGYENTVGQVGQLVFDRNGLQCELITIEQASKDLGYSTRHIRRLCEQGELTAIKVSGLWLIQRPSLDYVRERVKEIPYQWLNGLQSTIEILFRFDSEILIDRYNRRSRRWKDSHNVEELIALMVATVQDAGGSIGWNELMAVVPYEKRRLVMGALSQAKRTNQLQRVVRHDAEKGYDFKIVIPQGGE